MGSVGLFIHSSHRLFPDVLRLAERVGRTYVFDCDNGASEAQAAEVGPDVIFNYVTRCLFRHFVLSRPNANFHPAPPCYPGIGGVSRALYDGVKTFGTTAHRMVRTVDAGEIYFTDEIPIHDLDTPESLFARAEHSCVGLFAQLSDYISRHGQMPPPSGDKWSGRYMSIKEFHEEWLRMELDNPMEMERKLRAATHSKHPGPYVLVNGRKFVLKK